MQQCAKLPCQVLHVLFHGNKPYNCGIDGVEVMPQLNYGVLDALDALILVLCGLRELFFQVDAMRRQGGQAVGQQRCAGLAGRRRALGRARRRGRLCGFGIVEA